MLFRERLTVPVIWWLLAGLFSLSVLVAVGAYLGPTWGFGASVAANTRPGNGKMSAG